MYGAIHPSATHQTGIGRVDNGVRFLERDIPLGEAELRQINRKTDRIIFHV
jgi:hypothetical protein